MVRKTDYDTKVTEIENKLDNHNHDKYITTPEFNTLAADVFNARLARANLVEKTDFDALLPISNMRVSASTREILLAKDELNKLKLLIPVILLAKVILMKMVHKII